MNCPFPGKDPYLEHPVLWESVHARLMVAIANQLQPKLDRAMLPRSKNVSSLRGRNGGVLTSGFKKSAMPKG